jgi:hypothetical protein
MSSVSRRPCVSRRNCRMLAASLAVLAAAGSGLAQNDPATPLVETGQLTINGRTVSYRIRNLPVSSFPDLPPAIADALTARDCLIPQTYEARRPENVVHGSFERAGSLDWAMLCSTKGKVSLLVFFAGGSPAEPIVLTTASNIERLKPHDASGQLGFDWGIDPASPQRIRDAQAAMAHHPAPLDHDCIADSMLDSKTVYHLYRNGAWETVSTE